MKLSELYEAILQAPSNLAYTDIGHNPNFERIMWYIDMDYQLHEKTPKIGDMHIGWTPTGIYPAHGRYENKHGYEVCSVWLNHTAVKDPDVGEIERILADRWPSARIISFTGDEGLQKYRR